MLASKYCPDAKETHMGHMAQPCQHIHSTQAIARQPTGRPTALPSTPNIKIIMVPINHIFTDDTGRFLPHLRSGNQYIMVALHSESNAILVQAFKSKHNTHCIEAYTDIYNRLAQHHATSDVHILNNEASKAFLSAITANSKYQLVPPHIHRCNRAERAIQTFKDHFLTILAGTAPTCPKDRWDLLLPQAELTLNLLRPSNNPSLSAWHSLFGPFDFKGTTRGPAGCRVLIHLKAEVQKLWENCCHEGFYIGPALQHYCCYRVFNKLTGAVTISDDIKFGITTCRSPHSPWRTNCSMPCKPSSTRSHA